MSQIVQRVALNFTDLTGAKTGCTTLGSNKFWIGEVVRNSDGTCDFRCQWGSTGTEGSTKGSKYGISESAALSVLNKKVKSKVKKGYTQLETRTKDEETAKAASKGVDLSGGNGATKAKPAAAPSRNFHREVRDLLGIVYGATSNVVRSGLSATAGATEDNPIGNLSDSQLDIGGGVLDEIADHIEGLLGRESSSNKSTTVPLQNDGTPTPQIIDLTNRFMSNVPRAIPREHRGRRNLHKLVISSYERLEEQRKFLQLLRDAHLSQATFQAAAQTSTQGSKAAVWYDGLNCALEFVEPGTVDHKFVLNVFNTKQSKRNSNWWSGGRSRLQVTRVWKLTRNGSEPGFDAYAAETCAKKGATGRIWAWHGTRTENLLGIGKSGLLMPENLPRGVHISGKAFGRGIYHAPAWNATNTEKVGRYRTDGTNGALKSMNYTSCRGAYYGSGNTAGRGFMFLQELALGPAEVHETACWDKRRPDDYPRVDWIYANAGHNQRLSHDEIVTFSQDAQIFRFLIEVKTVR